MKCLDTSVKRNGTHLFITILTNSDSVTCCHARKWCKPLSLDVFTFRIV